MTLKLVTRVKKNGRHKKVRKARVNGLKMRIDQEFKRDSKAAAKLTPTNKSR